MGTKSASKQMADNAWSTVIPLLAFVVVVAGYFVFKYFIQPHAYQQLDHQLDEEELEFKTKMEGRGGNGDSEDPDYDDFFGERDQDQDHSYSEGDFAQMNFRTDLGGHVLEDSGVLGGDSDNDNEFDDIVNQVYEKEGVSQMIAEAEAKIDSEYNPVPAAETNAEYP